MKRLILFLLLLLSGLSWGQPVKVGHVQVELVSASQEPVPGQDLQVALRFSLDPHWHLYWKNPGASGFPPSVEWKLPAGWKAGEFQWPAPHRMVQADLHQFVFDKELILPVTIKIPADAKWDKPPVLSGKVKWLACAESCVPGNAEVSLTFPTSATPITPEVPESAGNIQLRAWRLGPKQAFLEFPGMPGDQVDFFPISPEANMETGPLWKAGQGLEIPIQEKDQSLEGVLVSENGGQRHAVEIKVPIDAQKPANALTPPANAAGAGSGPDGTILGAVLAAFLGGMLLNLMPCVFPVLSLKALSLVYHNEHANKPAWLQGWVYTAGVLISVWVIASPLLILKGKLGWGYQMQSPVFVFALCALFLLIGLNLFGLFEVGESLTKLASLSEGKSGLAESFWSGAVATVAATPCTGPFMASALGFAISQPTPVALLIFTMLGLGMACPYLFLCGFPATRSWLPRPGAWMESFKQGMGFPMLIAVVWFLYVLSTLINQEALALSWAALVGVAFAAWIWGRWGYSDKPAVRARSRGLAALLALALLGGMGYLVSRPFAEPRKVGATSEEVGGITWEVFSPQKVAELRSQGKPIFIDFTAAWCINCKVNEATALRNAGVVEALKTHQVVTLKADWTRRDETISKALAEFGRTGVPLYVVYPRSGEPIVLPEVLTPKVVLDALAKV